MEFGVALCLIFLRVTYIYEFDPFGCNLSQRKLINMLFF